MPYLCENLSRFSPTTQQYVLDANKEVKCRGISASIRLCIKYHFPGIVYLHGSADYGATRLSLIDNSLIGYPEKSVRDKKNDGR